MTEHQTTKENERSRHGQINTTDNINQSDVNATASPDPITMQVSVNEELEVEKCEGWMCLMQVTLIIQHFTLSAESAS